MNYQENFKLLDQYVQMKTPEDIKNFEFIVWNLSKIKNLEIFTRLMNYFDDNCVYPEVKYSIIHALEQEKPYTIYVKSFLSMINLEIDKRKEWIEIILYRILNDDECLKILKNNIQLANQKILLKLLDNIEKESIEHQTVIKDLKKLLN